MRRKHTGGRKRMDAKRGSAKKMGMGHDEMRQEKQRPKKPMTREQKIQAAEDALGDLPL